MNADISQLKSINTNDFKFIAINGEHWLYLMPPDPEISSNGAIKIISEVKNILGEVREDKIKDIFSDWLKAWNIGTLTKLTLSANASYTSRLLNPTEKEEFERLRSKLIRCKIYGINYYENSLFDRLS